MLDNLINNDCKLIQKSQNTHKKIPKKLIVRDYYPENVPINWRKIVMDNIETVNILYNI